MSVRILVGDCRKWLTQLESNSIDACVCDPPYHLTSIVRRFGAENAAPAKVGKTGAYERASRGFMGQTWDGGDVAFDPETWAAVWRVLKPGAHLVAFSAPRNYGRLQVAIEEGGFEIRDGLLDIVASDSAVQNLFASLDPEQIAAFVRCIEDSQFGGLLAWVFGSGFPKSHNQQGQWEGWGTALKPAFEPIILARKPLAGTVVGNLAEHGTGALNIDGCRIGETGARNNGRQAGTKGIYGHIGSTERVDYGKGRWPANIIHDGSDEVLAAFPEAPGQLAPISTNAEARKTQNVYGAMKRGNGRDGEASAERRYADKGATNFAPLPGARRDDSGSAARFFYCAKATTEERGEGNNHPTVKPIDLMRWLCRLITPPGGTVLDPFMGSGSTLIAADAEQFNAIGCELSADYAAIAEDRIRKSAGLFAEVQTETLEAAA